MAHLFNAKQTDSLYLLFRSIKGHPMYSLPKGTSTNFKTLESAASQKSHLKSNSLKIAPSQGSPVWKVMPGLCGSLDQGSTHQKCKGIL